MYTVKQIVVGTREKATITITSRVIGERERSRGKGNPCHILIRVRPISTYINILLTCICVCVFYDFLTRTRWCSRIFNVKHFIKKKNK